MPEVRHSLFGATSEFCSSLLVKRYGEEKESGYERDGFEEI